MNKGLAHLDVERLRAQFGFNELVPPKHGERLKEVLSLLSDPMAVMLFVLAIIYFLLGETRDGVVMLCALVPVLGVDVLLENQSQKALKALAASVAPRTKVIRDSVEKFIDTKELLPGDLIVFSEGDLVFADGKILETTHLAFDESSLTGESIPQAKDEPNASFFAGSRVAIGSGLGVVTEIGQRTRFGKISELVDEAHGNESPLQRHTHRLVKRLFVGAGLFSVLIFFIELAEKMPLRTALISSLSLTMSALPEEFPLVLTLFLSLGAWRLSKKGVLVKRVKSVESLGSTTVICLDKTGTLTEGSFSLQNHEPFLATLSEKEVLEAAVLACEIKPQDPMEHAIFSHAKEHGIDIATLHQNWDLIRDHPFDPVGKHMSHVWRARDGSLHIVAKGALEGILEHCTLRDGEEARIAKLHADLAKKGMRILAVAGRVVASPTQTETEKREHDENALHIYGLFGFVDPLRKEVPTAVKECVSAGIRLVMITGDHPTTAQSIAIGAGIPHRSSDILTGQEIDGLSKEEFEKRVRHTSIFARIRPEQKFQIVDALAKAGDVVAMTGDGINDAPALRRADVGVSMGQRATEVARSAAQLVLLQDSFAALVATVREGREILSNILRSFRFLVAFHVPIIGLALFVPILGYPLLLLPVHFVWLELIVHPVSALAFEGENIPYDVMKTPPRAPEAPLLLKKDWFISIAAGLVVTFLTLGLFVYFLPQGIEVARSVSVASLTFSSFFLMWSELDIRNTSRRAWIISFFVVLSFPVLSLFSFFHRLLHTSRLPLSLLFIIFGLSFIALSWRLIPGNRRNNR